jgi:hypothetical protein
MNSTTAGTARAWRKTNVPNLYVHRNGGYYYRVTIGGKQLGETLRTKLKSVAEAREASDCQSVEENDQGPSNRQLMAATPSPALRRSTKIPI